MKKNKMKYIIISICSIIVLAISVMFVKEQTVKKDITKAVKQTWSESSLEKELPDYLEEIENLSSYEVKKIKKEGNEYIVYVTVTGVDLGGKLSSIDMTELKKLKKESEINKYLLKLINQSEIVKTDTTLYAIPEDNGYNIRFSDEFIDAMSGKVYSYVQGLIKDLIGK